MYVERDSGIISLHTLNMQSALKMLFLKILSLIQYKSLYYIKYKMVVALPKNIQMSLPHCNREIIFGQEPFSNCRTKLQGRHFKV